MNSYEATFSITAEVLIKVQVTGEDQHEGLVAAHDAIQLAKPEQATVLKLNLDSAQNVDFKRLATQPVSAVLPPSPLSLGGRYKVMLYTRPKCAGEPALQSDLPGYEAAKALAESVLQPGSLHASAQVLDQYDFKVLDVQAERGDWEVEAFSPDPDGRSRRFSWLDSQEVAKKTALQLLEQRGTAFVRITDYTDRKKGPVLWKEIR